MLQITNRYTMGFALVFLKYLVKTFTIPVQDKKIIKHSGIPLEILQTRSFLRLLIPYFTNRTLNALTFCHF